MDVDEERQRALEPEDLSRFFVERANAGDVEGLSSESDATDESVEELEETEQSWEASAVEGVEDAADHPERAVHTPDEYGRTNDLPTKQQPE